MSNEVELDSKRRIIHAAAIAEFSARGLSATSMANIADAAGVSRPALYQYFRNKDDIFASAFVALFEDHADNALAALHRPGTTADQLNGFLQGFEGDLYERMAASPFAQEILDAKVTRVADSLDEVLARLVAGRERFLRDAVPGRSRAITDQRETWAEVLHLSPKGFKLDQPTVEVYRRRLRTLAHSVAADLDAAADR